MLSFNEKVRALKELDQLSFFNAQRQLEEELISGYYKKISNLELTTNLSLEYAKVQGAIAAIRDLQNTRKHIVAEPGVKRSE